MIDLPLSQLTRLLATCAATWSVASAQVGTNYCTAAPNSTGGTATISGSGSAIVALDNLVLSSANLPLNAAAFFICSRTQAFGQNPGGSAGNVCLGNPIGRGVGGMITNSGATGIASVAANLGAMPQPSGAVVVLPGETWNFQCWYRDAAPGGGATSNFSDGLEVLFTLGGSPLPGMLPIPPGTFMMGSDAASGSVYGFPVGPIHQVTITYPFWMGRYEVTQAEYQALMGVNPSLFIAPDKPVNVVTWAEARAYCAAVTAQEASNLPPGYEYRLPTEAEWEWACRAGTTTEYHYGTVLFCSMARIERSTHESSGTNCPGTGTRAVGSYQPNAFGLHDMHGNVSEWCLDSVAPYQAGPVTDPFVTGGTWKIWRGGNYGSASPYARSAYRWTSSIVAGGYLGIRMVLGPALVP